MRLVFWLVKKGPGRGEGGWVVGDGEGGGEGGCGEGRGGGGVYEGLCFYALGEVVGVCGGVSGGCRSLWMLSDGQRLDGWPWLEPRMGGGGIGPEVPLSVEALHRACAALDAFWSMKLVYIPPGSVNPRPQHRAAGSPNFAQRGTGMFCLTRPHPWQQDFESPGRPATF